jgi:tetratricopeptide (TPR) repeat protein
MDDPTSRLNLTAQLAQVAPSLLATTLRDFRLPQPASHPTLRLVGGCALLEEIGQGGMGVVYKARQLQLDRLVAIKMLRRDCGGRDDLLRFRTEAEAVAALGHPGIVQIHEVGEVEGRPYLLLEYVEGGSLDRHLAGSAIPPREAATLVHAIAEAIDFAHRHGVIHRDLKPANILLRRGSDGLSPKVTDFGLAKRLGGADGQTRDGEVVGTPAYMAPEQAEGRRDVGPASDIYAIGAILYECLTGAPPVTGNTWPEMFLQIRDREPTPPRRLVPGVPRDLETICLACLRKSPEMRYGSAALLAADLARFLEGRPIAARPVGPVERLRKWARRRPGTAAMAGVCGLFFAALLAAVPIHIHALRCQVEEGSREKIAAHERTRLATLRADCERHLAVGRQELRRGDAASVQSAGAHFAAVHEFISEADALEGEHLAALREEARLLLETANGKARRLAGAGAALAQLRRQEALRDEAFFHLHRDLLGGRDAGDPLASVTAGRGAMRIVVDLTSLADRDRRTALGVRQEVLLLVAEAVVRIDGSPGRLREALELVEEAERDCGPGRAVSMRRSRYLALNGDVAGARRERERAERTPPRDALDSFLVAQEFWLAGDTRRALTDLDRVLTQQPTHFWARVLRAVALQRLERPADARAELTLCIQAKPDFAWPYLLRAMSWLDSRQGADHARADLDAAARLPLDRSARYLLTINRGVLSLQTGDPTAAVHAFQAAVLEWPERPQGHANLARAYWVAKRRDEGFSSIDRAIRLDYRQAGLYRTRGRMRAEADRFAEALRDIDRTLELEPRGDANVRQHAEDVAEKARLLYRLKKYPEALPLCVESLRQRPIGRAALRLHPEILLELGRPREALVAFDRYLEHGKPDFDFYPRRAKARADTGDLFGGVEDFSLALTIRRDARSLAGRGWAQIVAGSPGPALRDFDEALRLAPTDEMRVGRATALADLGKRELAVEQVEAVLKGQPTSSQVLYRAARVLARVGGSGSGRHKHDRTIDVLRRAVKAMPEAERGKFWKERVRNDEVFRPLRGLAAFDKIPTEWGR